MASSLMGNFIVLAVAEKKNKYIKELIMPNSNSDLHAWK